LIVETCAINVSLNITPATQAHGNIMNHSPDECYAIIPAAGRSQRMGQAKLLLPWPTDDRPNGTLIDSVLSAWTSSCVTGVVVVVRADDEHLAATCRKWPVTLLQPETPPADMKASVQFAIQRMNGLFHPKPTSRCFVAPADLPTLTHRIIDRLAATPYEGEHIVVPAFGERQGHPALLPWSMMSEVLTLSDDQGIDQIVKRHNKKMISFPAADLVDDLDTPDEYKAARRAASGIQ
jgi:molybdenum cofactor cytidylyltransferase